jgi:hypothetical protein
VASWRLKSPQTPHQSSSNKTATRDNLLIAAVRDRHLGALVRLVPCPMPSSKSHASPNSMTPLSPTEATLTRTWTWWRSPCGVSPSRPAAAAARSNERQRHRRSLPRSHPPSGEGTPDQWDRVTPPPLVPGTCSHSLRSEPPRCAVDPGMSPRRRMAAAQCAGSLRSAVRT